MLSGALHDSVAISLGCHSRKGIRCAERFEVKSIPGTIGNPRFRALKILQYEINGESKGTVEKGR